MERQLRDLMIAEAGDPPHRVTVEAVRRCAIRRWAAQAGAASLAVILAVGIATAVSAGVIHLGTSATRGAGEHAGPPRYYVTQYFDLRARKLVMAVRARASGRITAVLRDPLPGAGSSCGQGTAGVTAADDQTFFMTCSIWRQAPAIGPAGFPRRPGKIISIESRIYRFQVTSSGRVTGYSLVKGSTLNGWADNIAVTADGSELAAEVLLPRSGKMATSEVPEGIFVINTRTGAKALWHTRPYLPGALQYTSATDLSFTGDGHELVVLEARCHRTRYLANCTGHADMQVRAYSPAAGGGSLENGQVLLQDSTLKQDGTSLSGAFINPGGSAVTGLLTYCPRRGACTLTVARIPIGTGQQARQLYQVHTGSRFAGFFERFFSADPSVRYLILDAGTRTGRVNGWIDHGRLVPLAPANGNVPSYESW